jgi:SSS family solute:Na+ symporter
MNLQSIDWIIIGLTLVSTLILGLWVTKRAGKDSAEYFLSSRNMPWYLLGFSMVATTFSVDTPNLVTDIVRQNGVAGNWVWWAFLLTGMMTVFLYAKLWRRSHVLTDIEFYELRYDGKPAAFLRGFRALYLGLFFNVAIMASVTLAAIKVGSVMLNLTPLQVILIAGGVTVVFSSLGGFLGVLLTDFVLFIIAMAGSVVAAIVSVQHPKIGGLRNLLSRPEISTRLSLVPDFHNWELALVVFIIPLAIQWWSVWYPGSEPGGGGHIAQRMLAAKNEKHAVGATLFFNFAHYALRPWPWIIVALSSLVVFPNLESIRQAFPNVDPRIIGHDMAYPAMLTYLPAGILGVVIASLIAAYMSTMSTCLNLGSSYVVNDFYKRFVRTTAGEKELVLVGRISTVVMMVLAGATALYLQSALHAFNILLQIGAGTGLLFLLRWFWFRVNPFSEISAMGVSLLMAVGFLIVNHHQAAKIQSLVASGIDRGNALEIVRPFKTYEQLVIGVGITTLSWILVTLLTKPSRPETLEKFYRLIRPGGAGWKKAVAPDAYRDVRAKTSGDVRWGIAGMILGCLSVYSMLFAAGYWIYGQIIAALAFSVLAILSSAALLALWKKGYLA